MLQTCRQTSDSDEEQDRERAYFVLVRINLPCKPIKLEFPEEHVTKKLIAKAIEMAAKEKAGHINCVAAIVESGDYAVVPFGGLQQYRGQTLWRVNGTMSPWWL